MDAAVATKSPAKSVWSTCTVTRQTWVWRAVGKDASISSPNPMTALRAEEWLQEEKLLAMESGCALFAALCKEDLIYSQPMNQLTLNLSLELKP